MLLSTLRQNFAQVRIGENITNVVFFREEEYVAAGHAVLYKEEKTKEKKKRGKKSCKDRF